MLTSDLLVYAQVHKYSQTSMHVDTQKERQTNRDSAVHLGDTCVDEIGHALSCDCCGL